MAEAFKNLIGPATVQAVSHHLRRVHRRFDTAGFEAQALDGLQDLEFKARAQHLARALMAHLPEDFDACAGLLEASLKRVPSLRFDHDPEVISLRRGTCTLHGSGYIGLGGSPSDPTSASVHFDVLRFGETVRKSVQEQRRRWEEGVGYLERETFDRIVNY